MIRLAKAHDCKSITVENLDFVDARQIGRETLGSSRRGKRFRRIVSGMPTRQFRDVLVGMTANAAFGLLRSILVGHPSGGSATGRSLSIDQRRKRSPSPDIMRRPWSSADAALGLVPGGGQV